MTSFGSVPGFPLDLKKLHPPRTQLAPIWSLSELKTITKTVLIFCARAHKILEGLTGGNGVPVLIPWALKDAPWGASWPQFGGFRTSKRSQKRFSYFVRARAQNQIPENDTNKTPRLVFVCFFSGGPESKNTPHGPPMRMRPQHLPRIPRTKTRLIPDHDTQQKYPIWDLSVFPQICFSIKGFLP